MVSIRYRDRCEIAQFAAHSIKEARDAFQPVWEIPGKARAKLNGKVIEPESEPRIILGDDDELLFIKPDHKGLLMLLGLFTAIAVTGSVFAYGFLNGSTTFTVTMSGSEGNFVDVSANNSDPIGWVPAGSSAGETGNGTLWDINTLSSNYGGDLLATIYLTNLDKMKHVYRGLGLFITAYDSTGNVVDLNGDGLTDLASDVVFLSLNNGVADLTIPGAADIFTIFLDSGFFITQPYDAVTWVSEAIAPNLYIELSQR
jgi:hypothetical protein